MHRLIRNTHLALGVAFTLMWLMYALSSVQMAHPAWFPMEPETTEERVAVEAFTPGDAGRSGTAGAARSGASDPEHAARFLAVALGEAGAVRGDVRSPRFVGDTLAFQVVRPGTVHEVRLAPGAPTALVTTHRGVFMAMLNRLHHYAGFHHGWIALDVWGLLVAGTSVGLILLGLSGLYLWFRTWGERRVGGLLLGLNVGVSLLLIVLLRLAR